MTVSVLGDENTPEGHRAFAQKLINHLNGNLLDEDVLGVMLAAYPTMPLAELVTFNGIMGRFWADVENGREFIENNGSTEEGGDADGNDE